MESSIAASMFASPGSSRSGKKNGTDVTSVGSFFPNSAALAVSRAESDLTLAGAYDP